MHLWRGQLVVSYLLPLAPAGGWIAGVVPLQSLSAAWHFCSVADVVEGGAFHRATGSSAGGLSGAGEAAEGAEEAYLLATSAPLDSEWRQEVGGEYFTLRRAASAALTS